MKKNLLFTIVLMVGLYLGTAAIYGQISFTAMDVSYSQNFDWWGDVDRYFSNNSEDFPGFYSFRAVDDVQPQYFRRSSLGEGGATYYGGNFYNFGHMDSPTERACGLIYASGTGALSFGFRFKNNTGSTIKSIDIAFWGEQWGVGNTATSGGSTVQTLFFDYLQGATVTDLSLTTYTRVSELFFNSPVTDGNRRAINGNLEAHRTYKTASIDVTIPAGEEIMLRWIDDYDDPSVYDHRMAIDELVVTPRSYVTGTNDLLSGNESVVVYPNPVREMLNFSSAGFNIESVSVFDMTGRRVISEKKMSGDMVNQLNVETFRPGIYFVEINSAQGVKQRVKFIKE